MKTPKYKVGIFIPIYFREPMVQQCLLDLAKSDFDFDGLEVFLCIGINGASAQFKNNFLPNYVNYYKKKFSKIHIVDLNENLGKPKMINHMTKKYPDFTHMVSIDSDMQSNDVLWLYKFLQIFYMYDKKYGKDKTIKPLGALCSNQLGNNCHLVKRYSNYVSTKIDKFTLYSTPNNSGVAGGVLITPKAVWEEFGGYYASNMYGSDDGHYTQVCFKTGRIMAYVEEIHFYHPHDTDASYIDWKLRAVKNELRHTESKGYFENLRKT